MWYLILSIPDLCTLTFFCCLLIAFANSLDPGQYRQNIGLEIDTDRLPPSDSVPVIIFEKAILKKKTADDIKSIKMT